MKKEKSHVAVVGDVHGHLQLALCMLARWQKELGLQFDSVLLCGDVGTFILEEQLDNATRRHARQNPCELEFIKQWAMLPNAPWLDYIFKSEDEKGLGLQCPVIMVHGNHEGFDHLSRLVGDEVPQHAVGFEELPFVDSGHYIRLLPSGWRATLPSGHVVAGVGGIQFGQRKVQYHQMAYIDDAHILGLLPYADEIDIVITHQGPEIFQGDGGSDSLNLLVEKRVGRAWFHGHTVKNPEIKSLGAKPQVVPLEDVAFIMSGKEMYDPGKEGWSFVELSEEIKIVRETPSFWRDFRFNRWLAKEGGILVAPPLAPFAF